MGSVTAKNEPRITLSQVLCALAEGCGALETATILGYTSTALLSMQKDEAITVTDEEGSWIGAAVPGMALLGSLVAGRIVDSFGRRKVSLVTVLPSILMWLWVATSSRVASILVARLVGGAFLGVRQVAISVFVSETVHPALRPVFSIIPGLMAFAGFFMINFFESSLDWRGMAWLGAASTLPVFLLFLILPETPYYLLSSGKRSEALDTLKWLKSSDSEARKELKELQETVLINTKKETTFSDLLSVPFRWSFCMAVVLHVFQQMTAISVITSFMGLILENSGSSFDIGTSTLVLTIINIAGMFMGAKLMMSYERKPLLIWSSSIIITSFLLLSFHLWRQHDIHDLSFLPLMCLALYSLGFSFGWGPIPWIFLGDSLPLKIRGIGSGLVIAINWGMNFVTTLTYGWAASTFGLSFVFFAYAAFTFFGMLTVMWELPETTGFTEAKLDKYYADAYKKKQR